MEAIAPCKKIRALICVVAAVSASMSRGAFAERYVVEGKLQIEVAQSGGSVAALRSPHELAPQIHQELLLNPPRVVFDVRDVVIRKGITYTPTDTQIVRAVRVGRHGEFTRVVFDLTRDDGITLAERPGSFTSTEVSPSTTPRVEHSPVPSPSPSPSAAVPTEEAGALLQGELTFSINKLVVALRPDTRPVVDVMVKNLSKAPLYMLTGAQEIVKPGMKDEQKVTTSNLLVSPRRFELGVGEERQVRLVLAKHSTDKEKETVFRVNFVPDAAPFDVEHGQSRPSVTTGIAMLVIEEPLHPRAVLKASWSDTEVVLHNEGNTNLYLDHGQVCSEARCVPLPPKRLYAGTWWHVQGEGIIAVRFLQKRGEEFEQIELKRE